MPPIKTRVLARDFKKISELIDKKLRQRNKLVSESVEERQVLPKKLVFKQPPINIAPPNINVTVPEIKVPEINVPDIIVPEIIIPEIKVPTPEVTINPPDITVTPPEVIVNPPEVRVLPPEVNISPPEVNIVQDVNIDRLADALDRGLNKLRTNAKDRPLAVRLSDGKKFISQLEKLTQAQQVTMTGFQDGMRQRDSKGGFIDPVTSGQLNELIANIEDGVVITGTEEDGTEQLIKVDSIGRVLVDIPEIYSALNIQTIEMRISNQYLKQIVGEANEVRESDVEVKEI